MSAPMWKVPAGVLLMVLAATATADAQSPHGPSYSVLDQAARSRWLQFTISAGRLVVGGAGFGNFSTANTHESRTERLTIRTVDGELFVQYDAVTPEEQFAFEVRSNQRIHLSRTCRGGSAVVSLDLQQEPNEPLRLAVGDGPRREVRKAASLWHLLVEWPELCRTQLVPLLEVFRPQWQLIPRAQEAEEELFHMASCGQLPDRCRWTSLVTQLSDDRFARREAADRDLRAAGPALLPFLQHLDFRELDAEQQVRLRRIIGTLTHAIEDDTAEQIASWMIADPDVWLALLSRPDEPTRRLAAAQLEKLLGESLSFHPAGSAELREREIVQLRTKISAGAEPGSRRRPSSGPVAPAQPGSGPRS